MFLFWGKAKGLHLFRQRESKNAFPVCIKKASMFPRFQGLCYLKKMQVFVVTKKFQKSHNIFFEAGMKKRRGKLVFLK